MAKEDYRLTIASSLDPCPLVTGLVWAEGIRPPVPTKQAPAFLEPLLALVLDQGEDVVPAQVRQRVRQMLRYGRYKPSGRSKPASEFLLRAALEREFPLVNAPVDVNNAISLESGFPGSIFDADLSGRDLLIRHGVKGEAYVFNPSGQTIDLEDLLLVCRRADAAWVPCGNPVKDAMSTKITPTTSNVIAVLYVPGDEPLASAEAWTQRFASLLAEHCQAESYGCQIVTAGEARESD